MSFGGVTWFALLPFSMQGTLLASVPAKQTSRGGQGERWETHRRQAGHRLSSHRLQPHAKPAAGLRHQPAASASAALHASRAIGTQSLRGCWRGRWRNSCDKKLETDIIIVHSLGFIERLSSYKSMGE